jgi:hypothetical protein
MKKRAFSNALYRPVYQTLLTLINDLKGNRYHEEKFNATRKAWAQGGR